MTLHCITSAALMDLLNPRGLSDKEALVLMAIASGRGQPVSRKELIHAVYGEYEDGGPAWAMECLRQYIYRLRAKGYNVRSRYGWGYSIDLASPTRPQKKRAA